MPTSVKAAFRPDLVNLEIARLTPLKKISPEMREERKYGQIAASLTHVGLLEPIVVFPAGRGKFLVLDGHKRLDSHEGVKVYTDDHDNGEGPDN
jgi:hypothetical protein